MNHNGFFGEYLEKADDPHYFSDVSRFDVPLIENTTEIERPANQLTITKRYTERALEFIETIKKPFSFYI